MVHTLIIIFGLALFETVSSIDNAIVNAHVLSTVPEKYKKFFLFWGLIFAVFVVRGILPFVIVWLTNPGLSFYQVLLSVQLNFRSLCFCLAAAFIFFWYFYRGFLLKKKDMRFWWKGLFINNQFGFMLFLQYF